ncbi:winged helix DNA-binding domain-containing protein [Streptomyces sp. ME19-01-6]|uniref:winged helix DNA-binding domain-containing protein n=1 Tax=Streptomyces sp. ME19-01-6 TaxID=3028686 RepID=UPI0029BF0C29|nr:winged helix DNA-binding domain-containing protein [Streptomyces sp. ME19-01-6]MDX3230026.1 winged helix DNA-binding domain-containing protein [Streptomyces sp. ME19-01-6]
MTNDVLGPRALNRALLQRQLLLDRSGSLTALEVIERLVGMQSQAPGAPYIGLWTRLDGFAFEELARLMREREVVRMVLMRGTVHLVTAADALRLRPLIQPMLDQQFRGTPFVRRLPGVAQEELVAAGRKLLERGALSPAELRAELGPQWPDADPGALVNAVRLWAPLVQVPPRGLWGKSGGPRYATVEDWLGRPMETGPSLDAMVLRYLAAFGPATVADIQKWCGLTGLREVVERLGPDLRRYRDESGRELYDRAGASLPDPDTPVSARFVAEFDNLLLSHADRARILADEYRWRVMGDNAVVRGTILVDGFVAGIWKIERARGAAALRVTPFVRLGAADREALEAEGARLLATTDPAAGERDVRFEPVAE